MVPNFAVTYPQYRHLSLFVSCLLCLKESLQPVIKTEPSQTREASSFMTLRKPILAHVTVLMSMFPVTLGPWTE